MSENFYAELAKINVGEHIEKKGKFSYLSWAYAVDVLRKADPTATWEVKRFDGVPFMKTECGYFVEVAVTVKGITLSQIHPVLDNYNKPISQPNSFQINTSIQRCLVKAIALHGLGLYIYAGEDLPTDTEETEAKQAPPKYAQTSNISKPNLLAKWKLLGGTDENFGPWYDEQKAKKLTNNKIDEWLTKKLLEKKKGA
jgi:hypothetical protein